MFPFIVIDQGISIPSYGIVYLTAFLSAIAVFAALMHRMTGLRFGTGYEVGFQLAIAGEIGARLLFVITEWEQVVSGSVSPRQFLVAGRVVLGGVVAGLLFAIWAFRHHRLPIWTAIEAGLCGTALGMGLGRLGCLLAGCCFGAPTDWAWGITFHDPMAHLISGTPLHVPLHPTQILQMVADLSLFAVLLWRVLRPHVAGEVAGLFLIGAAAIRFALEFLRGDPRGAALGLSTSQWISLGMLAAGALVLAVRRLPQAAPVAERVRVV